MVRKCGTIQAQKSFNRSSRSQVKYLNLVDDEDGVLRVGGRVGKSSMECHAKFLVVLPSKDVVIERIMWFVHKKDGKMDRFTAEVLEVPGVSDEEKFTTLCNRVKN